VNYEEALPQMKKLMGMSRADKLTYQLEEVKKGSENKDEITFHKEVDPDKAAEEI